MRGAADFKLRLCRYHFKGDVSVEKSLLLFIHSILCRSQLYQRSMKAVKAVVI